jgi:hypothetical protein
MASPTSGKQESTMHWMNRVTLVGLVIQTPRKRCCAIQEIQSVGSVMPKTENQLSIA